MLNKGMRDDRQDHIQNDMRRIAGAVDRMGELLSGLLERSRIGRVINSPEEVDLVSLTRGALETLDARISSKNITVNVSPELPSVHGDRIRLREVLENLIDNAAKYTGDQPNPLSRSAQEIRMANKSFLSKTMVWVLTRAITRESSTY
jgi:signal transduction histidine kinase